MEKADYYLAAIKRERKREKERQRERERGKEIEIEIDGQPLRLFIRRTMSK